MVEIGLQQEVSDRKRYADLCAQQHSTRELIAEAKAQGQSDEPLRPLIRSLMERRLGYNGLRALKRRAKYSPR